MRWPGTQPSFSPWHIVLDQLFVGQKLYPAFDSAYVLRWFVCWKMLAASNHCWKMFVWGKITKNPEISRFDGWTCGLKIWFVWWKPIQTVVKSFFFLSVFCDEFRPCRLQTGFSPDLTTVREAWLDFLSFLLAGTCGYGLWAITNFNGMTWSLDPNFRISMWISMDFGRENPRILWSHGEQPVSAAFAQRPVLYVLPQHSTFKSVC